MCECACVFCVYCGTRGLPSSYKGVAIWVTKMYFRKDGSQLGNEIMIDIPCDRD